MKRNTQREIVEEFISMVEETSLSKTKVADLIARLGINRNTFYYYFSNKQDVALWILRTDLDRELRAAFVDSELVCSPCFEQSTPPRSKASLPFTCTSRRARAPLTLRAS